MEPGGVVGGEKKKRCDVVVDSWGVGGIGGVGSSIGGGVWGEWFGGGVVVGS